MSKFHDILVIGTGGLSKQCLEYIKTNYKNPAFFDNLTREDYFYDYPLYHEDEIARTCEKFIVLVSNPVHRRILVKRFNQYRINQASIISNDFPNKILNFSFNWNGVILEKCIAEESVKLGKNCLINTRCSLHHGVEIGEYTTISPSVTILGDCIIGDSTFIGAGTIIKEKTKIGKNVLIGMGSVVVNDIPDNEVWFGNPAKFIKKNEQ